MVTISERSVLFVLSGIASIIALGVAGYSLTHPSIYRELIPDRFLPGTFSQDMVSVLAAFGLLLCIGLIRRGRSIAWLVWTGLLGYLFYAYALYSFDRLYTPLFLFYLAIMGCTIYALILFFRCADLSVLQLRPGRKHPPRKPVAALFLLLAVLFVVLWLSIIIPGMRDRTPPEGNSILVLDLAFVLPLLAIEARLLAEKAPLGDVLAIPILIKAGTLGLSVLIGTLLAPWFNQEIQFGSVLIYALMGGGPLLLILPFLRALTAEPNKIFPS